MRLYGMVDESIVDGQGYRAAIFAQGCPHHCEGCHNPESHDFSGGREWTLDEIEKRFSGNPLLSGVTLTGGEPFCQSADCAELARRAKKRGLTVWAYTGYTYEQLAVMTGDEKALLDLVDVLVDGRFVLAERSLELLYKGSRNQRIIDMEKTRARGSVVLWEEPKW